MDLGVLCFIETDKSGIINWLVIDKLQSFIIYGSTYEKQTIEHVEVVNVEDCGILTVLSTEDNSLCILVNYQPIYKQVLPQKISNFLKEMANYVVPPDLRSSII